MSYTIRIEPTGHSFTALPEETLLEAALRSGININYNCSSGSCGDCKAQLLAGEVESLPADYLFTLREKNAGYVLLCSTRAASDLVIAAQEARSSKDIPLQRITTKVAKIESRGEDIRILQLRTPRTKTLRFLAGQYAHLWLPGEDGIDAPLASCPCNGMQLQFHFRRQEGIPFLDRLFSELKSGDRVELEGPSGDITLDEDARRPLLMIAVGEGFASIKSLIEHAINLDMREPVRLFWLADKATGHYLENYCRSWEEVLDDYRFRPITIAGAVPDAEEIRQLLERVRNEVPGLAAVDIFVAGPWQTQQALKERLPKWGAEGARIFLPRHRRLRVEAAEIGGVLEKA